MSRIVIVLPFILIVDKKSASNLFQPEGKRLSNPILPRRAGSPTFAVKGKI